MAAKEFLVAVTAELTGKAASLRSEGHEGGNDIVVMKGLEAEAPVEPCSTIDKNKGVLVTANRHTVAESDIHVNDVEILGWCAINRFAPGSLGNGSVSADGCRKFTVVDERAILGRLYEMPVIAEMAAASDPM